MNRLFLLIFLITVKLANAGCAMSYPAANLGVYSASSGNSVSETFTVSSCSANNLLYYTNTAPPSLVLSNGTSSITASLSYGSISGSNQYNFAITSGASTVPPDLNGNGTYGSTISVPSGKTLTAGSYTGNITLSFGTLESGWPTYSEVLTVNMTVGASCSVSSSGAAFGNINGGSQATITGSVSSTCTNGAAYTLATDGGNSANISARTMKNGSNSLNYQLYTDSGYTTVWGDGTTGSKVSLTGTGSAQTTTIYGKVPSGQRPTPGSYTDTVNVTMTY